MSKYDPLHRFFQRLEAEHWRPTFMELERMLGFDLPAGARKKRGWWEASAAGNSHARAWTDAGWRVQDVDLEQQAVNFVRARERAEEAVHDMRERLSEASGAAVAQVREHPLAAAGISAGAAFAAGVALGYLLMRATRDPEPAVVHNAETQARRALAALTSGLHAVEEAITERVRHLRG